MKIIKSYLEGFTSVLKTKKLVLTIYLITIVFALVLAIPFENTIKSEAGSSMAFTSLLKDFDYTVYKDFMNKYSISIQPYLSTAFWMGMFYILFTIFFEGGIFTILKRKEEKYSLINFWGGSTKYFSRFLRLAIYSIIIQVIVALAIYIPLLGFIDSSFSSMASEATAFYIFLTGAIIHILIFIFILVVTDYTKIMIVENEELMPFKTWVYVENSG